MLTNNGLPNLIRSCRPSFATIVCMKSTKENLINDIQNLLNRYDGIKPTHIDPNLLQFMDESTLRSIIDSLLRQQERTNESNIEWLEQFKKH